MKFKFQNQTVLFMGNTMPDIKLKCETMYEYDPSYVGNDDDPDTPLCVVSIDEQDAVFISPLPKDDDNGDQFIALVNGKEHRFKSKDELLKEIELDQVDKTTADKFFAESESWIHKLDECTIATGLSGANNGYPTSCIVENTHYSFANDGRLFINGNYAASLTKSDSKALYESLSKKA